MQDTTVKSKREMLWHDKYDALKAYFKEHHQLPDKKKADNRELLNWWKYNKKCIKSGRLPSEKIRLLKKLNDMRLVKDDGASQLFAASKRDEPKKKEE